MRVQVPLSPIKSLFYFLSIYPLRFSSNKIHYLSHSLYSFTNGSELKSLDLIPIWIEPVQMNIYGQRISIIESFTVHIIILTLTCQIFYYFLVPLINIDTSTLLGWCTGNGRDSSVGRAEDWKSSCHQFKSGSWHVNNVSDRYSYKLIETDQDIYSLIVKSMIHTYSSSV